MLNEWHRTIAEVAADKNDGLAIEELAGAVTGDCDLGLETVVASRATVLLQGEPGTRKDMVAKGIHDNSPRCQGPLVRVGSIAVSTRFTLYASQSADGCSCRCAQELATIGR